MLMTELSANATRVQVAEAKLAPRKWGSCTWTTSDPFCDRLVSPASRPRKTRGRVQDACRLLGRMSSKDAMLTSCGSETPFASSDRLHVFLFFVFGKSMAPDHVIVCCGVCMGHSSDSGVAGHHQVPNAQIVLHDDTQWSLPTMREAGIQDHDVRSRIMQQL